MNTQLNTHSTSQELNFEDIELENSSITFLNHLKTNTNGNTSNLVKIQGSNRIKQDIRKQLIEQVLF